MSDNGCYTYAFNAIFWNCYFLNVSCAGRDTPGVWISFLVCAVQYNSTGSLTNEAVTMRQQEFVDLGLLALVS